MDRKSETFVNQLRDRLTRRPIAAATKYLSLRLNDTDRGTGVDGK